MPSLAIISHSVAALLLFLLFAAQCRLWYQGRSGAALLLATFATLIWSAALVWKALSPGLPFALIQALEVLRNGAWFCVLLNLLGLRAALRGGQQENKGLLPLAALSLGIPLVVLVSLGHAFWNAAYYKVYPGFGYSIHPLGFLLMAIIGLMLLEQVLRNIRDQQRWHLKFLCLALGILFSYDLYLYSDTMLFGLLSPPVWITRGFVVAVATLLFAISLKRTSKHPLQVTVSRRLVFHSGVLFFAGIYLLVMASIGYYIRSTSAEWGVVLQSLFWLLALSLLAVMLLSGRVRTAVKVYISRNLFSSRYDYREEWLRLSRTLSLSDSEETLPQRAVRAMSDIVDCPGGALWLTSDDRHYDQVVELEMGWVEGSSLTSEDPLIGLLLQRRQVIDLDRSDAEARELLPEWLADWKKAWLLIPLLLHDKLLGFIVLRHSRVDLELNWEDYDVLNAAAQQTASYLSQMTATEALAEARQFSAFNQMSAFVVHDIKTLNAQLSLLVSNAARHKSNPAFIEDMIKTSEHAVTKMNFLLQHFKNGQKARESEETLIDLVALLRQVVASRSHLRPLPRLLCQEERVLVRADEEELKSALGHLVQNSQEATDDDGSVSLELATEGERVTLTLRDSGSGMTQEFINTRLFRPFVSTKGLSGMGVGVYQSREYLRRIGGNLHVKSQPGVGTEFILSLSRAAQEEPLDLA